MRVLRGSVAVLAAALPLAPVHAAVSPIELPPARVGDAWSIDTEGIPYDLRVEGRGSATDRWGRELPAFRVRVDGFHPLSGESKRVSDHTIWLHAASGAQVADVATYVFGDGAGIVSEPAAYSSFEPNDPDGWPGWVHAGGLLAGRTLVPGGTVTVPFVMTSTRGAGTIALSIEEAPPVDGRRCARATGATDFPSYTWYNGGYQRGAIKVALELLHCEGSPFAERTEVTYSGAFGVVASSRLVSFAPGGGEAVGTGGYQEPALGVRAMLVPWDGTLRDGGVLPVTSLEEAQDTASLSPALLAWRLLHADGMLVEAEYLPPDVQAAGAPAGQWRLVYAAPSGDRHQVVVRDTSAGLVAVESPVTGPYPAPVPARSSWPAQVVSPAGAIASWRAVAGPGARLTGLRWQPLLDHRWYVAGTVAVTCDGQPCGTVAGELPFDFDTGAAGTGEHPVPAPAPA